MTIQSIPAPNPDELPNPTSTGNWVRNPDGSLSPQDEATARTAGLWQDEEPQPE